MLKSSIGSTLLLCLSLIVISPAASSDDRPKVEELAVFGVMLGQDADQVIKAMTGYFSISQDDLTIEKDYFQKVINRILYSFDQTEMSVHLSDMAKNSDGETIGVTSSILFEWKGDSDVGDKLLDILSEFSPPSLASEYSGGQFSRTWCDTLNAAKDQCASGSDGILIVHRDGSHRLIMGRG